ncbi:hypothetical protein F5Y02DRAFT_405394 [Annulohypoxylon stygium]|nr:hypothetical protein F5Y02DRAFT_405394 [Annulohypoxylon stygium]
MIHQDPRVKHANFYKETVLVDERIMTQVEIGNLLRVSDIAAELQPVNAGDMTRWMKGWQTDVTSNTKSASRYKQLLHRNSHNQTSHRLSNLSNL